MHPRSAMLPYQLVERQLQRPYQIKQLPVLCLAAACDVSGLAKHMLTCRAAAPLLAMQNEYDMLMAERDASFMENLKQIRRIAAIF